MESLWSLFLLLSPPLLLLIVANGSPILARQLLGERFDAPLDGGRQFIDGRPMLGPTKSWRGVGVAIIATISCALLLGLSWWLGALVALLAMLGDAVASFTKRRLAIAPHGRAVGLDQIPEALLPLWLLREGLGLGGGQVLLCVLLFMLLEMILSPLLYRWHIRLRPY
ncbi:MAG: CDP-archaeol synthase [Pseudomonadota bacterium]